MAANKTQETDADVAVFVAGVADAGQRADADTLIALLSRVSGDPPKMWGPSIIGFGTHRYRYESGREGETCRIGGGASRQGGDEGQHHGCPHIPAITHGRDATTSWLRLAT